MTQIHMKPIWKLCADIAHEAEQKGDLLAAEKQYALGLTLSRHACGAVHEDVGEALINLADFYFAREKYEQSEALYRQALDLYDKLFGTDNLVTAMIYRVLAEVSLALEHEQEARIFQARAMGILHERQAS